MLNLNYFLINNLKKIMTKLSKYTKLYSDFNELIDDLKMLAKASDPEFKRFYDTLIVQLNLMLTKIKVATNSN